MEERLSFLENLQLSFSLSKKKNKSRFHPATLKKQGFSAENFDKKYV